MQLNANLPHMGYEIHTQILSCRVLKTKAASPVYHLDGGVYGWYRAFGDEGFTGTAVNYNPSIKCIVTVQVQLQHNRFCLQGHMTQATSGGLQMQLVRRLVIRMLMHTQSQLHYFILQIEFALYSDRTS